MAPTRSRGHITSTKCTPSRETASPCVTQKILRWCCPLPGLYLPSPSEKITRCNPSDGADFRKFRLHFTVMKNWQYLNPLLLPVNGFGEEFSCAVLCACFHSLSLPSEIRALSSSTSALHSSYLPWVVFSTCRCASLFSKTFETLIFWDVQNMLFICVRGRRQA